MGPTAVMSLIVAENVHYASPEYIIVLNFFTGIVQVLIGVLQMSASVNYVPHPVISGFTSGAALFIKHGQVKNVQGIDKVNSDYLIVQIYQTYTEYQLMGLCCGCHLSHSTFVPQTIALCCSIS